MLRAQIIIIIIIIIISSSSSSSISIITIVMIISVIILDITCTNYYCISYAIAAKNPHFRKIVSWKLMLHLTFALKNKMNLRETDVVSNLCSKIASTKDRAIF